MLTTGHSWKLHELAKKSLLHSYWTINTTPIHEFEIALQSEGLWRRKEEEEP